jgi:hypothetical protein
MWAFHGAGLEWLPADRSLWLWRHFERLPQTLLGRANFCVLLSDSPGGRRRGRR